MNTLNAALLIGVLSTALFASAPAGAELPKDADGNYVVVLDQLARLVGDDEFVAAGFETAQGLFGREVAVVLVGFQIQNFKSHETLDMFPLEPGESRESIVAVSTDGVRYRCPINPTPWYELDNVKEPN